MSGPSIDQLVQRSVMLLRLHEPPEGYWGCFSGGKDSVAIRALADISGVKIGWHYNNVTIDPPELVQFIRKFHPDVQWAQPKHGNLISRLAYYKHMPPTRRGRWCCREYKEQGSPKDRVLVQGVRRDESVGRKKRLTACRMYDERRGEDVVFPIRLWSNANVWEFIRSRGVPYCSLYDEGFTRLGCIGCPLASEKNRRREFERWPRYEARWKWAFQKLWERKAGTIIKPHRGFPAREWYGSRTFRDWRHMWDWWTHDKMLVKKDGWT